MSGGITQRLRVVVGVRLKKITDEAEREGFFRFLSPASRSMTVWEGSTLNTYIGKLVNVTVNAALCHQCQVPPSTTVLCKPYMQTINPKSRPCQPPFKSWIYPSVTNNASQKHILDAIISFLLPPYHSPPSLSERP